MDTIRNRSSLGAVFIFLNGQAFIYYLYSMAKKPQRPRDTNQLAKSIVDLATGETDRAPTDSAKNPAAVALGRLGGLQGGRARANKLSAKKRKEIAQKAAKARWGKKN